MFIGEYTHNIDAKGRIIIPSKFRDKLSASFILTRGIDNCLNIYTKEQFDKQLEILSKYPSTKAITRQFMHVVAARASICEPDKMGRIQIPLYLAKEVNIKKECSIIGVNDHVEIWDKETWETYYQNASENFAEVAENISDLMNNG